MRLFLILLNSVSVEAVIERMFILLIFINPSEGLLRGRGHTASFKGPLTHLCAGTGDSQAIHDIQGFHEQTVVAMKAPAEARWVPAPKEVGGESQVLCSP